MCEPLVRKTAKDPPFPEFRGADGPTYKASAMNSIRAEANLDFRDGSALRKTGGHRTVSYEGRQAYHRFWEAEFSASCGNFRRLCRTQGGTGSSDAAPIAGAAWSRESFTLISNEQLPASSACASVHAVAVVQSVWFPRAGFTRLSTETRAGGAEYVLGTNRRERSAGKRTSEWARQHRDSAGVVRRPKFSAAAEALRKSAEGAKFFPH